MDCAVALLAGASRTAASPGPGRVSRAAFEPARCLESLLACCELWAPGLLEIRATFSTPSTSGGSAVTLVVHLGPQVNFGAGTSWNLDARDTFLPAVRAAPD